MGSPTQTLQRYLAACERRETKDIAACFAADAVLRDPMGELQGLPKICLYFEGIYADLKSLAFQTGPVSWCNDACAVSWQGKAERSDGMQLTYEGIDVFAFGEDNLIKQLWAFWTPADLIESDIIK